MGQKKEKKNWRKRTGVHCGGWNSSQTGHFVYGGPAVWSVEGNPRPPRTPRADAGVTVAEKYLLTGVEHDTKCEGVCLRPSVLLPVCRRLALCSGSHYSVSALLSRCGVEADTPLPPGQHLLECVRVNGRGCIEKNIHFFVSNIHVREHLRFPFPVARRPKMSCDRADVSPASTL